MKSSQQIHDEIAANSISGRQQKRNRFDHNESDDDENAHNGPLDPITTDQFFLKSHQHHRRGRGHSMNTNQSHSDRSSFQSKPRYGDNYDDIQRHYNENTSRNVTIKERTKSRIFQLRNLNNWIKSVLINSCIRDAQSHLEQLSLEVGLDPHAIYVPSSQPGWDKNIFPMFQMEQNDLGVWEIKLDERYPSLQNVQQMLQGEGDGNDNMAATTTATGAPPGYKRLHTIQNVNVLDFCGGKGGDLFKYMENYLSAYVLADIADVSVQNAIDRYNETLKKHRQRKKFFPAQFLAGNLSDARLHYYIHPQLSFDVVSCQFAFHYGFQTEQTLRRMLENVSDRLRPGGFFCGTIPDARVLFTKLNQQLTKYQQITTIKKLTENTGATLHGSHPVENGNAAVSPQSQIDQLIAEFDALSDGEKKTLEEYLSFGNDVYQVEFDLSPSLFAWIKQYSKLSNDYHHLQDFSSLSASMTIPPLTTPQSLPSSPPSSSSLPSQSQTLLPPCHGLSPFGIKYRFTLVEAVEGVPEYVVIFPVLCQLAAEYGLKPVVYENTLTYYKKMVDVDGNRDLLTTLRVFEPHSSQSLPADQWEGVSVYCVFAFQKVGEITYNGETIYQDTIDSNLTIPHTDTVQDDNDGHYPADISGGDIGDEGNDYQSTLHTIDKWAHIRRPPIADAGKIRSTPLHSEIRPIKLDEMINIHEIERSLQDNSDEHNGLLE